MVGPTEAVLFGVFCMFPVVFIEETGPRDWTMVFPDVSSRLGLHTTFPPKSDNQLNRINQKLYMFVIKKMCIFDFGVTIFILSMY